jgi:hypothetical protein
MESNLPHYQPLDLASVEKQLSKQTNKINSDKDLEGEIAEIMVTLKDLSKFYFDTSFP